MRWGSSVENWRRSRRTGGRPKVKKRVSDDQDGGDENDDGDGARGAVAANVEFGDAGDDGRENDGEERADVDDLQLFEQVPGEVEREQDGDAEEDVAAYCFAGFVFRRG